MWIVELALIIFELTFCFKHLAVKLRISALSRVIFSHLLESFISMFLEIGTSTFSMEYYSLSFYIYGVSRFIHYCTRFHDFFEIWLGIFHLFFSGVYMFLAPCMSYCVQIWCFYLLRLRLLRMCSFLWYSIFLSEIILWWSVFIFFVLHIWR